MIQSKIGQKRRKKIGIIGGVGPQASQYLYGKVMECSQRKYAAENNSDFPELVLYSTPVPDFISNREYITQAETMFREVIAFFNHCQVDRIIVASNTVHLLLKSFQQQTDIPFISIIDAVIEKIVFDGRKKVGLLASPMTVDTGLYQLPLEKRGIELITPHSVDQDLVESMMRAIISGNNNGQLRKQYVTVTQSLFDREAEAIILGCTELPMAINYEAIGNKVYNSMSILAEKIVDYYYA